MQWAQAWMTGHTDNESNVVDWIRVARGERPEIAAKLSNAGLTPPIPSCASDLVGSMKAESRDTINCPRYQGQSRNQRRYPSGPGVPALTATDCIVIAAPRVRRGSRPRPVTVALSHRPMDNVLLSAS